MSDKTLYVRRRTWITQVTDKYADYVDHPRYGRSPNVTGLDPDPFDPSVSLHWNATSPQEIVQRYHALTGRRWPYGKLTSYTRDTHRIRDTAILADLSRQTHATVPVTHYYDLDRKCCDCGRRFIFFAEEQKHWYEELGFGLDSDCVRCVPCRKREQGIARKRERYEELFHVANRTSHQNLEMAECCLALIEASIFTHRQTERVRMLLNRVDATSDGHRDSRYNEILDRVRKLEKSGEQPHALERANGPETSGESSPHAQ